MDVLYDTRHETQERLWSGSSLRTANVLTQARIYPDVRVAYTEKTISIANQSSSSFWQEEALYTFYLPEGSVVSSLSLWINGVEEKSYLTTRSKADSAYRTIVGREARDPSVAHWQEGNTVKVKVFPCTSRENRKFKIGITSPLKLDRESLVYENSWFKGPGASDANETIRIEFPENTVPPQLPFDTTTSGSGFMVYEGKYQSSWNVRFKLMPLTHDIFSFDGKSYALEPLVQTPDNFRAEAFYLDINQSWTKDDLDTLWPLVKDRPVFVADERLIRLTSANKDELFKTLSTFHFSIFPTHQIPHPETALLVTKSGPLSPTLHELDKSPFAKMLSRSNGPAVRAFIIGDEPSPYIKSLDELRIIRGEKTDWQKLKGFIAKHQFPADPEKDPSVIRIDESKTLIREIDGVANGQAPDHLLRLFAYNHIMKQIGGHYLDQSF
ncbi:XrtN system VIT domain-containing protein [Dyadobacter sp. CY261]|uniref:XrtN system VIT domain-containing protein n=1 Tax=Dyadobacter sp. CY261 TaxID=2907203 RepID=UPI001F1C664E|nr:XrtN system VIT domain-containing protein [Dyadobacter sp. CY261]MCF0073524.1 XrtN system VIT domain-containing protein [Dyadobacter sp. CY261]